MTNENIEYITPMQLAKESGQKPQAIYNLARQGYIVAEDVEVIVTKKMISRAEADAYLLKRSEREAKKNEVVQDELNEEVAEA